MLAAQNSSLQQQALEANKGLNAMTDQVAATKAELNQKEALIKQLEQDIMTRFS